MKDGTAYAARLSKVYARFRHTVRSPKIPEPGDPIHCLATAVLGVGCTEEEAEQAIEDAFSVMVDWNDVRVSRPLEVHRVMSGTIPDGVKRIQQQIDALQDFFDRENRLSLERLRSIGRREARQYLEGLNGVDEHAVASVLLWSLGGHAIPVNDRLLEALRNEDLVHPTATRAEVQAFLERHISAAQAKEFCVVMRSFPGPKRATAKHRKSKVPAKSQEKATP